MLYPSFLQKVENRPIMEAAADATDAAVSVGIVVAVIAAVVDPII